MTRQQQMALGLTGTQKAQKLYDFTVGNQEAPIELRREANINLQKDNMPIDSASWSNWFDLFDYDMEKFERFMFDMAYLHEFMPVIETI